jgi:Leucine-rich repeat (LRR) protein
MDDDD